MIDKLRFAQLVLEGLATQNFQKMQDGAERLLQISNQTEWFAFETPQFKLHTNEFRRAVENIIKKSKEKTSTAPRTGVCRYDHDVRALPSARA